MKIGTGIDIIEVSRIQEAIEKNGEIFLEKVYTNNEIAYCENTKKMKYQHYAARFAAKEAVFKAISAKIDISKTDDILKKIEIQNEENGKPYVNIEKLNNKNQDIGKIIDMNLSMSHIKDYAVASFTILFE